MSFSAPALGITVHLCVRVFFPFRKNPEVHNVPYAIRLDPEMELKFRSRRIILFALKQPFIHLHCTDSSVANLEVKSPCPFSLSENTAGSWEKRSLFRYEQNAHHHDGQLGYETSIRIFQDPLARVGVSVFCVLLEIWCFPVAFWWWRPGYPVRRLLASPTYVPKSSYFYFPHVSE